MRKIETKEELIEHLTRVSSAYRKSYKFYGVLNRLLQITGGIVGSTAVLAIVSVIPVFIAAVSVIPVVIGIITNATKLGDKKNVLKSHHKKFNSLLSFVHSNKLFNEKELIKEVFSKINDIHNSEDYTEPLEMYIKRYKLNGYDIESSEEFKRFTIIDNVREQPN
mgnify:FL=1